MVNTNFPRRIIKAMHDNDDAWPFKEPVDAHVVMCRTIMTSSLKIPLVQNYVKKFHQHSPVLFALQVPLGPLGKRPRSNYSYNRKKFIDREYTSDEDREYATHRAEEVQKGSRWYSKEEKTG